MSGARVAGIYKATFLRGRWRLQDRLANGLGSRLLQALVTGLGS